MASDRSRQALEGELREAVGDESVDKSDLELDRAIRESGRHTTPETSRSRLMLLVFAATGIVVVAIVALALQSWIALIVALGVHAIATIVVVAVVFRTASETEKPDPTTAARLEDEGVDNPEGALTALADQAEGQDQRSRELHTESPRSGAEPRRDEE